MECLQKGLALFPNDRLMVSEMALLQRQRRGANDMGRDFAVSVFRQGDGDGDIGDMNKGDGVSMDIEGSQLGVFNTAKVSTYYATCLYVPWHADILTLCYV